jgi:hypothetical protein
VLICGGSAGPQNWIDWGNHLPFAPLELISAHPWRRVAFTTYALSLSFFEAVMLDAHVRAGIRGFRSPDAVKLRIVAHELHTGIIQRSFDTVKPSWFSAGFNRSFHAQAPTNWATTLSRKDWHSAANGAVVSVNIERMRAQRSLPRRLQSWGGASVVRQMPPPQRTEDLDVKVREEAIVSVSTRASGCCKAVVAGNAWSRSPEKRW